MTANDEWIRLLNTVSKHGNGAMPRGLGTREGVMEQSQVHMARSIVTNKARRVSYRFAAAEALWILQGSNRLDALTPYAPGYAKFSDDGRTLAGAYGPSIITQIPYVVSMLEEGPDTRQAVMSIWRPNPRWSNDIPCTIGLQFLLRGGTLQCNVFMRSSDLWLGWIYDIFSFSMVSAYIALLLKSRPGLGWIRLVAGSQHIYERNLPGIRSCLASQQCDEYRAMSTHDLTSPDHLMECLGCIRDIRLGPLLPPFFNDIRELANGRKEA